MNVTFKIKQNWNKLLAAGAISGFILVSIHNRPDKEGIIALFHSIYNERIFLSFHLALFLICLLPVLKYASASECMIRMEKKWDYLMYVFGKIVGIAVLFSFMITFVWFLVEGIGNVGVFSRKNILYTSILFVTQFIGWNIIGSIELFLYLVVKNLALSYVLCYAFFILTNLSLYITHGETYVWFARIYDVMFQIESYESLWILSSVSFSYIALILGILWGSYWIMGKRDYMGKGARENEEKQN